MLVRSKKKKKILLKWEKIVFQSQIPELIIFMYLICTSKKLIPIICLYTVNTCMIAAMFTALLYFLQWKKFLRKKMSTLQLSFLCSRVLQTLHRHQTTLCNVRTAERMEDSTEGNFGNIDAIASDPKMFLRVILFWFTCTRKVKHLHQLQADIQNLFNNSPANSICQIHFPMNQKTEVFFSTNEYRWRYSSTFKLFPPKFRPNDCINKFILLYCFNPLFTNGAK